MRPARSILNPEFIYTDAANTDIRKLFARARRKIAAEAARQEQQESKVTQLKARAK